MPFHPAYYLPLRDRGLQIARAQYSRRPCRPARYVRDLQIDFWLLDRKAFSRKYWHKSYDSSGQLRLSAPDERPRHCERSGACFAAAASRICCV